MALAALRGDEQGVIFSRLCNPLDPGVAVAFSSTNKELWTLTQAERQQLHTHIVERMLTSARTTGGNRAVRSAWLPLELREEEESVSSSASTSQQTLPPNVAAAIACGPPAAADGRREERVTEMEERCLVRDC